MTKKRERVLAWIVLSVFILVIFSSSVFIVFHSAHNCTGENCPVCAVLAECRNNINMIGTVSAGAIHIPLMICVVFVLERAFRRTRSKHRTLISLKVELLS